MKKIRILPILLIICTLLCSLSPAALALDNPVTYAQAIVLADADTGRILYAVNADEQRSPASLTKIMTTLIAVEKIEAGEFSLDDYVTAQYDCQRGMDSDSSTAGIVEGEQMTLRSLLYCAVVHSANDACNVIASYMAGSIDAFVELMNQRAAELGCTATHFADPNGLSNDNHYSTAMDLYRMTLEAMKHPLFMELSNTLTATVPATNKTQERVFHNSNALLTADSQYGSNYLYEGASGVKTGYTRKAGYCLISSAEREGVRLVAVVLGCNGVLNSDSSEYGNFVDTISLYNWAFSGFSRQTVLTETYPVEKVHVELAEGGDPTIYPREALTALLPNDADLSSLSLQVHLNSAEYTAPLAAGTEMGKADVYIGGEYVGTVTLQLNSNVELAKTEYMRMKLNETLNKGWVKAVIVFLVLLLVGYIALVIRYRMLRRRHLEAKRRAEQRRRAQQAERNAAVENTRRFTPEDEI